jgi:cyclopropane-fatty-acyl-phospholipid synthase
MATEFTRVVSNFEKRYADYFGTASGPAFAVRSPNGTSHVLGRGEPSFTLAATDQRGMDALASLDTLLICEAYLSGAVDVEGDIEAVLASRDFFPDVHPLLSAWRFIKPKLTGQVRNDQKFISHHYDTESDFFLLFLDNRHRCYSHGLFNADAEPLEDGISRKLDFAFDSIEVRPGDRVLDVGGGWGSFTEYGGKKDVEVTSITISRESERFLNALIAREKLPCKVRFEHLYEHKPEHLYDAIVVLGVTEHLPDYAKSLAKYRSLLKPGGKVYLDASAQRKKYDISSFLERHIYPGNGSPMCLHDYLRHVAESPFRLEAVYDDRHDYRITAKYWAERLDRGMLEAERRWGLAQYRKFRLYLWGCYDGFKRDRLQAYRVVLGLPSMAYR